VDYRLVYDASTAGPSAIGATFFAIGAIMTTVTAVLVFRRDPPFKTTAGSRVSARDRKRPWGFFLVACLFTLVSTGLMYGDQSSLAKTARRGGCTTISGPVADFVAMSGGRGSRESFNVSGIHFSYSDFATTGAFNNSARFGGPIRPGLAVRICYAPSERTNDNLILRLEVAS